MIRLEFRLYCFSRISHHLGHDAGRPLFGAKYCGGINEVRH